MNHDGTTVEVEQKNYHLEVFEVVIVVRGGFDLVDVYSVDEYVQRR